ncbi:MAG TPA: DUF2752 domain-containing protein [Bacteroidota bacterium]|nr:DUF2752 domain-containing protein [Bacteroidota bacterium]
MKRKVYRTLLLLSVAGYGWLGWNLLASGGHGGLPTVCLFKEVTGLPCPSCGTTRSIELLLHGDLPGAFVTNPLGLLLALGLFVIPGWIVSDLLRKDDSFYRRYVRVEKILLQNAWVSASAAAVVLVNWAWNIAKGL